MLEYAALLIDRVLPTSPIRQQEPTVPIPLCILFAVYPVLRLQFVLI